MALGAGLLPSFSSPLQPRLFGGRVVRRRSVEVPERFEILLAPDGLGHVNVCRHSYKFRETLAVRGRLPLGPVMDGGAELAAELAGRAGRLVAVDHQPGDLLPA